MLLHIMESSNSLFIPYIDDKEDKKIVALTVVFTAFFCHVIFFSFVRKVNEFKEIPKNKDLSLVVFDLGID